MPRSMYINRGVLCLKKLYRGSIVLYGMKILLSLLVAVVLAGLGMYVALQQQWRSDQNHPQIEMAAAIVQKLTQSGALLDQVPPGHIKIESDADVFIVLYDTEGAPIVGNGYLDNALLQVPKGVFTTAKEQGENRRTLEPKNGVRIAAVIKPFVGREANGFVLVGRRITPSVVY